MSQFAPLTAADIGLRVTVRRRVADEDGSNRASDVLGVLEAMSPDSLAVRRRDDSLVTVPHVDVLAVRRVPAATNGQAARSAQEWSDLELEQIAWTGWPGLEHQRLGDWILRAGGGFTGRANSALPLGEPGMSIPEAIGAVQAFYSDRGLRPTFQIPLPLATHVDEELTRLQWETQVLVQVMVADVEAVLMSSPHHALLPALDVRDHPDGAWLDAYHYRGGFLPEGAVAVIRAGAGVIFASVREADGSTVAIARAAINAGWVGVTAVEVAADARRRGLGTHVMRELVAWAGQRGARYAYLQVTADNEAALRLYRRMGFGYHHAYHYRVAPMPSGIEERVL